MVQRPQTRSRFFRAARAVLDPCSSPAKDVVIEVVDGVIRRVRPDGQWRRSTSETIDFRDGVLTAGIGDAHVHLGFDGSDQPEAVMRSRDRSALDALIARNAAALVARGVTTVRDLGCLGTAVTELAGRWMNDPRFPRVIAANQPLTRTGGHCDYMATMCDDLSALLEGVAARHSEGAEVVKIMLTGGFMHPEGDTPFRSVYDRATLQGAVEAAHSLGMTVAVHAHGTAGIAIAAEAGADSVEHCSMASPGGVDVDRGVLSLLADSGTHAIPTVSSVWDQPLPWAPRDTAINVISQLHGAGVRIAFGTDTGIPGVLPGDHVSGLQILAEAGLPPEEVWAAATVNAAQVCGLGERVGLLRPGSAADMLVLDTDPRDDLAALANPRRVIKGGLEVPIEEDGRGR
ncbi:MAG TPA: amidohydrolase family protein [Actinomycetales bacterium]|nr:amidohydrolase family protein [Actinomycetales bacterium]